ncbi:MAG: hypothetical protein JWQ33_469, partial [Ramlibacter sp.]|nr:hypothetical protein [Ramlibacter sp.]
MGEEPVPKLRAALRPVTHGRRQRANLEWAGRWSLKSMLTVALTTISLPALTQNAVSAYVDRVLESGPQPDASDQENADARSGEGWPRSLRLEYSLSSQRGPSASLMRAIAFTGFLDAPGYGALSLNANLTSQRVDGTTVDQGGQGSGTWRIDQRGMPFNGGWMADHSAGDVSTLTPYMARSIGRIFLPSTPISGLSGRWYLGDSVELNASSGDVGLFTGIDINGFSRAGGHVNSAGGQARLGGDPAAQSRTDAAVQVVEAKNVPDAGPAGSNVQSTWAALAWEGAAPWGPGLRSSSAGPVALRTGGLRVQGNWMQSTLAQGLKASGGWLDAAWRTDWLQNTAGLFYLEPGLRWGTTVAASDLRGTYWRAETSARQWNMGWSIEASDSVSGLYGASRFGNVYGRYHLDSRNSVGSTLALRTGNGAAQSVQLSWDHTSGVGQTQWRGNILHGVDIRTTFAGIDHVWALSLPITLATSLGWEHSRAPFATSTAWSWGILGSFVPFTYVNVDASVRGARGNGDSSLNANVGVAWRFSRSWSLAARYTESRGQDPQLTQVVSALTAATLVPLTPVPATRSLQFVVRYEDKAGSALAPLGGAPGVGAGGLQGTVFFDADGNGRREAAEAGVPNVTVVLDRRYVARTDAQG